MADISAIELPDGVTYDIKDKTSGYITGMTILSYGNSTWQNFIDAYNANKVVYCRASSNSNPASGSQTRLAFMAYVNNATTPTEVEFQYYRSVSSHSDSQQGDQVYVYKLNKTNGWSVTVREADSKIAVGTGLSKSYSSGTITLSLDTTRTASSSQNGLMSSTDYTKLDGIASGAEVNVQADWSESDSTSDAYILNKPEIASGSGVYSIIANNISDNIASGDFSFAEGSDTTASGNYSHAEGMSTASGHFAHSEGLNSTASGYASHVEGNGTTASGMQASAHNLGTIAQRRSQTVVGEYNNADVNGDETTRGDYAFIIGNGTSDSARSNMLTINWNGGMEQTAQTSIADNDPAELKLSVHQTDNNVTSSGFIRAYDNHDNQAGGTNMVIQSNGNLLIGSGSAAQAYYNANLTGNTGKYLYLTSDESIHFFTDVDGTPFGTTLNQTGIFYPRTNGTGQIGSSSYRWGAGFFDAINSTNLTASGWAFKGYGTNDSTSIEIPITSTTRGFLMLTGAGANGRGIIAYAANTSGTVTSTKLIGASAVAVANGTNKITLTNSSGAYLGILKIGT